MDALLKKQLGLVITVIGVGGCGCNTINMLSQSISSNNIRLIAVNTDIAALSHCNTEHKILIGEELTNGYGAGADPEIGRKAAQESEQIIRAAIEGSDVLIITAGFGGGTGTGASPFIAEIAQELNIPSLAVVTLPFKSESTMRMSYAIGGIIAIKEPINAYITLSNDLLLQCLDASIGLFSAFNYSNSVLKNLLTALTTMLTQNGVVNVDINDFSKILSFEGEAILGVGKASSKDKAFEALSTALDNPLVNSTDIAQAQGVIIQICCKHEISMAIYDGLLQRVNEQLTNASSLIVAGVTHCPDMQDDIEILVIASGINEEASNSTPSTVIPVECNKEEYTNNLAFTDSIAEEDFFNIPTFVRRQMEKIHKS